MFFLFKYRFLQTIREVSVMFWALAFPVILGTLFYFSFGSGIESTGEETWDTVKAAVITEDDSSENAEAFRTFLKEASGKLLKLRWDATEAEALEMLDEGKITGIYYVKDTPSLTVGKNGLGESILTGILDSYNQNYALIHEIASTHPEQLPQAFEALNDYRQTTREETLGGQTLDPNVQYFFALIAYACLSGAFLGVRASFDTQADLSPLGARRSVTPTHKLKLVITDMTVLVLIHFINILILNVYISQVLGISLGDDLPSLILVDFMGSVIGVCMGLAFGSISKMSLNMKMGLSVALTLVPGFLAGLMFGNMKNLIELHCPVINRLNPAAVLSDAFYCLGIYNDMERFTRCLLILGAMSILLFITAFLGVRRETYDSI